MRRIKKRKKVINKPFQVKRRVILEMILMLSKTALTSQLIQNEDEKLIKYFLKDLYLYVHKVTTTQKLDKNNLRDVANYYAKNVDPYVSDKEYSALRLLNQLLIYMFIEKEDEQFLKDIPHLRERVTRLGRIFDTTKVETQREYEVIVSKIVKTTGTNKFKIKRANENNN